MEKRKHNNLRKKIAIWVELNIGKEWVEDALNKYDSLNNGVPIGNMIETVSFLNIIEQAKKENF